LAKLPWLGLVSSPNSYGRMVTEKLTRPKIWLTNVKMARTVKAACGYGVAPSGLGFGEALQAMRFATIFLP
jgi:hypothetical protein